MKHIEQTKFSLFYPDGKRATYGNCLIANIASILEESINEVPNVYVFYGMEKKETLIEEQTWFNVLNIWLKFKHNKIMTKHELNEPTKSQYVIMRGLSPKDRAHTCVYENTNEGFVMVHDPHPLSVGLKTLQYYYTIENVTMTQK